VQNVYGHLGYELYPQNWPRHRLGYWLNTSVAHNATRESAPQLRLLFPFWTA